MEDFLSLCEKRQSCRKYTGERVEHEKLLKCVEAASLAPSACNSQPWSFVLVESPEKLAAIAESAKKTGVNGFISKAGALIAVVEEHAVLAPQIRGIFESQYFARGDVGAAIVCACMAAADQGLGSCVIGAFDRVAVYEALDIPVEKRIAAIIAVGYAEDESIRKKQRKPIDEIIRVV